MLALATLTALAGLAAAAEINVLVAPGGALVYEPPSVTAAPGDVLNFQFTSKNFTVTQSSFAAPCVAKQHGVNSGFVAVAPNAPAGSNFTFAVQDTTPAIFFSEQGKDCEAGMIFTVNASKKQTAAAIAAAEAPAAATTAFSTAATAFSAATAFPAAATPAAKGQNIDVQVGPGGALVYQPPSVTAAPGDTVTFAFTSKNFTVTQSSFAAPCVAQKGGINSGFVAIAPNSSGGQNFTLTVKDTTPQIFFSAQGKDCEAGMIFTLNASKNQAAAALAAAEGSAPAAVKASAPAKAPVAKIGMDMSKKIARQRVVRAESVGALVGRMNGGSAVVRNVAGALVAVGAVAMMLL